MGRNIELERATFKFIGGRKGYEHTIYFSLGGLFMKKINKQKLARIIKEQVLKSKRKQKLRESVSGAVRKVLLNEKVDPSQSLDEAPVDDFLAKKDASLPDFVSTLKTVAGDDEFRSVAGGGKGDGNPNDEVVQIERTSVKAISLLPTQAEIGLDASLKDQMNNKYNAAEAALKMREQALKTQETQMKLEIENKKLQLESLQRETDMDTKVASLEMKVSEADAKKELKELELQFKGFENNRDREIELLKTQINALTKIYTEDLKQEKGEESPDLQAYVRNLEAENQRLREQGNTNES